MARNKTCKIDQMPSVFYSQEIYHKFVSVLSVQKSLDIIKNTKDTITELPVIIPVARDI